MLGFVVCPGHYGFHSALQKGIDAVFKEKKSNEAKFSEYLLFLHFVGHLHFSEGPVAFF